MEMGLKINEDKREEIVVEGRVYDRFAIRTPLITQNDDLQTVVMTYAAPFLQAGDILFISEKMVACTQGRAIPLAAIRPSRLGIFLSRFVHKSAYGIGLSMPETMTMAIAECGQARILLAAAAGALGRVLGRKGWFYRVAGRKAAAIDGPCPKTIAPYNEYVVLGPENPDEAAEKLAGLLDQVTVLIVDVNDLGGEILGSSGFRSRNHFYAALLGDNPLGQTDEQTPMGIIRPAEAGKAAFDDCWQYLLDWHI